MPASIPKYVTTQHKVHDWYIFSVIETQQGMTQTLSGYPTHKDSQAGYTHAPRTDMVIILHHCIPALVGQGDCT